MLVSRWDERVMNTCAVKDVTPVAKIFWTEIFRCPLWGSQLFFYAHSLHINIFSEQDSLVQPPTFQDTDRISERQWFLFSILLSLAKGVGLQWTTLQRSTTSQRLLLHLADVYTQGLLHPVSGRVFQPWVHLRMKSNNLISKLDHQARHVTIYNMKKY